MRYQVRPIADENCDSLGDELIAETDELIEAKQAASKAGYIYGAGIEDQETGQIDVGFGFGVACPDPD